MAFEAISNRGEYISAHYLAELFAKDLTELRKRWTSADRAGAPSSRSGVKRVRREYFEAKVRITENKAFDGPEVRELNGHLLAALAYVEPEGKDAEAAAPEPAGSTQTRFRRGDFGVMQGDKERSVPVALAVTGPGGLELVALDVTWQVDGEFVVADVEDGGAQLLDPIQLDGKQLITGAADAVTFLFGCEDGYAPRYVLLLAGGAVLLADRTAWHEGRFLAVSVDEALDRNLSADGEELEAVAALFGAESLLTEGGVAGYLDGLVDKGRKHAVGVSKELREGLRQSVELIAQEILDRLKDGGADPAELGDPADLASRLTRESLRYLYRILFLLYAEARPELGILPSKDEAYQDGYGLSRLGELVSYDLPEEAQNGTHFADSLDLLFRLVDQGHRPLGTDAAPTEDGVTVLDADGLRFEALRSDLFKADATPLIGSVSVEGERIDTRLRNKVLWRVLNLLMLTQGRRSGRGKAGGGTGKGFISYAQLGINQLGAVYEGLMSYTGFFAWDDLYEVAKPDSDGLSGTWVVPLKDADNYDEEVFVKRTDDLTGVKKRVLHKKGTFVYRLSGRERQRSASYYTPEVLTRSTVKHALAELLDQDGVTTPARAILDLTVCEPALGSGAFLNEAINQLAAEYLKRRMAELGGEQLPPDRYEAELQKAKAYLALHNCYGVDLNQTAVELAEVSLWLNSMHEGLKAPWFGLHLRRGNSLIGARRAVYAAEALKRKAWLTTVPTDRPLRAGVEEGQFQAGKEIHHFLLPAKGWGAVADAKQAKELAKDERDALAKWRTAVTATPSVAQGKRLLALATRVERLWELTRRRLIVSEREVRRQIDVWEVDPEQPLEKASGDVTREQIESALNEPGSPRGRLKLVMDAWCALWFWPVGQVDTPTPPSMEEWLSFCEAVLGVPAAKAKARQSSRVGGGAAGLDDKLGLFADTGKFEQLATDDEFDRLMSQCADLPPVMVRFPWLSEVDAISRRQGFFHWELEFAHAFERGGFDLLVGNPPWVRLDWEDHIALAEHDAWFGLNEKAPENVRVPRRSRTLSTTEAQCGYLGDLNEWSGSTGFLKSPIDHPALEGIRTNLYMNFMELSWRNMKKGGAVGLIHPDSHFNDPKAGILRSATYGHLRRHFQFTNELKLFSEIDHTEEFGIHVYGNAQDPSFLSMHSLYHPDMVDRSMGHDGSGNIPGVQFESGGWDCRPHRKRIVKVTDSILAGWAALIDEAGTPPRWARTLRTVTEDESRTLQVLARFPSRMVSVDPWCTAALNERTAKERGLIFWESGIRSRWTDVILQGPHFTVSTPFAKQPNELVNGNSDYSPWDLENLPASVIPRTNYARACSEREFSEAQQVWGNRLSTDYFRVAWRRMAKLKNERYLQAAIIPPGPTHVDAVQSLALATNRETSIVCGLWAGIPIEYMGRTSAKEDIRIGLIEKFPLPLGHLLATPLLLRALRLNCLTHDYAPLWGELFETAWLTDRWTDPESPRPPIQAVEPTWSMATPLRTEYDRRMALVEIDALVAVMLGLTAEQLCAMYRSQFAVLRKYEWEMFFAPDGHKIGAATHNVGIRQTPEETAFVKAWAKSARAGDPTPAIPEGWVKPNREAEMTRAHADFTARLHAGEYGDYAAYLAEHALTTRTPTPAPESR
ncbi:type II restriction endonuclease subunit M [Streptomyces samsunensis]|uniref:Eco57I restriction-modification methylase domain-containing protein n=1 Tax=Streptomyces malaysiensis TaxID=92644 RepID=UPI001581951C|nr:type II restriction endonuclease subunit M [Streptomyces samsunensis]NUH39330.1 type II restriction endonuclease subunit M [Streptomyces samsunensis]